MAGQGAADRIRGRIGAAIFERVAGPQGPSRARLIHLPRLPVTETMLVRPAGQAMVHAIRWATTAPRPAPAA